MSHLRRLLSPLLGISLAASPLAARSALAGEAEASEPRSVEAPQGGGAAVNAEDDARARELYDNGAILYAEGRYRDAISAFEEAYRLSRRPALLYNIANAYERMGDYEAALEALNRYRAFAAREERAALQRRIQSLEERAAATPTPPAPTPEPPAATPPPEPAPTPTPIPLPPETPPEAPGISLAAPVLGGFAVMSFGVGLGGGLRSQRLGGLATDVCVEVEPGALLCPADAGDALHGAERAALVADLGIALALGFGVSAGVVYLLGRRGHDGDGLTPARLTFSPFPLMGGAGFGLRGRF